MQDNICGLYAGQVVSVKDPEHRGRIKVKIAELLGEATSSWCEPCVPCCFEEDGDFCLPKLKDYVWIAFMNGDLDTPVYLGGWWTENNTPLGEEYKGIKTKRIIGFEGLKIQFDSKEDSLLIEKDEYCSIKLCGDGVIEIKGKVDFKDSVTVKGSKVVTKDY